MIKITTKPIWVALSLLVFGSAANADTFVAGNLKYETLSDTECTVKGRDGDITGALVIPGTVSWEGKDYTVVSVASYAFQNVKDITSLQLPATVKAVGWASFDNCSALAEINLGSGVESLDQYAFSGCSPIELTIPANVKSLGYRAFNCPTIQHLTFEDSSEPLTISDGWGSVYFTSLESLYYGRPFNEDSDNLRPYNTDNLTTITFGEAVTFIPNYFASGSKALTKVVFGGKEQRIGSYAFQNCIALPSIDIPASCKAIGWASFDGCSALTEINLGTGVESLDQYAFSGCSPIELTIPANVKSMGYRAFYCSTIQRLTFEDGSEPLTISDGWGSVYFTSLETLYYGRPFNENGDNLRPYSADNLKSIKFGKAVTFIPNSFATSCEALTDLQFSGNEVSIGSYAFQNSKSLEQVRLPGACTTLGWAAFDGSGLTTVTLPGGLQTIEDYALNGTALVSITSHAVVPPTVNSSNAFSNFTYENATLYVPEESIDDYKEADVWSRFINIAIYVIEGDKIALKGGIRWTGDVSDIRFDWTGTTGMGHRPDWEFTEQSYNSSLEHGTDYKINWADNIWPGTATLTVTGIGRYTGELTATFQIDKAAEVPNDSYSHDIWWHNNHRVLICEGYDTPEVWTVSLMHEDKRVAPVGLYRKLGTQDALTTDIPSQSGEYELWLEWPECELNYKCGPDSVGTYSLFDYTEQWAALKEIHKVLTTMLPEDMAPEDSPLKNWNFDDGPQAINGYYWHLWMGEDGSVTGFDLSNYGFAGTFPKVLFKLPGLKTISMSNWWDTNKYRLSGNLSDIVAEAAKENLPGLQTIEQLYVDSNDLTGNIGEIAAHMPNLKEMNVSYNRFTEIHPMVPQDVVLTYHNQSLDVTVPIYTSFTDEETIKAAIPEICTYKQGAYSYEYNVDNALNFDFVNNYWDDEQTRLWSGARFEHIYEWDGEKNDYGYTGFDMRGSWADAVFYGKSGDTYSVNQYFDDSYFRNEQHMRATITFDDYDVNWKGGFEVGDVQRTVSYITDNRFPGFVFNFTAANVVDDDVINVQDVALLITKLLEKDEPAAPQQKPTSDPRQSMIFIDDAGRLCLSSAEPVSAFEVSLRGAAIPHKIPALDGLGLSYRVHDGADYSRLVVYTFDPQKSIAAGILPLFVAGNASSVRGLATDFDGNRLTKPYDGVSSGVTDIVTDGPIVAVNSRTLQFVNMPLDGLSWRVISTQGSEVARGSFSDTTSGTADLSGIPAGIYLVETAAEGVGTRTVKIIIK